jgi:hypothetical protein
MDNIVEFFNRLAETAPKKDVVKYCKKLAKRKTLNAENAVDELCDLCVWLYVYDEYDFIMQCAEPTHALPVPEISGTAKDGLKWYHLYDLWGMEIRALRLSGQSDRASALCRRMDHIQMTLRSDGFNGIETPEQATAAETERRRRITYNEISNAHFLELAEKPAGEQGEYRITKRDIPFYQMRGIRSLAACVEAGVYPNLDIEKAEETIARYVDALRKLG